MDAIAQAKKHPKWESYSDEANIKINLSLEVFSKRRSLRLNQKELAKRAKTTQNIISKIEAANYNAGILLLARIHKELKLDLIKVFPLIK